MAKGDCETSVLESAKALETCLRILTNQPGEAAEKALQKYKNQFPLPIQFDMILKQLCAYRGDAPNVAHATKDGLSVTPYDAQFYFVTTCTAINYLINRKNIETTVP
jgi:hypothetical protein